MTTGGPNPVELIGRKRDGGELSREEYAAMIGGYLDGSVSDGQMAALLMAGVLNGFSDAEARALTEVLWRSGQTLDLSGIDGPTVDKHSTGGVGDGTTLVVAPLLAAAGATVVKLSGRGLGHTGGTLDKLEAVPGLVTELPIDRVLEIAREVGCVVAAQTADLVPADKALYALRDVTGTVASTALIASSVMSKKLASGAQTIVLDVKTGDGAFMVQRADAQALAALCVDIGTAAGRRCAAVVSWMGTPLGSGIGNGLEVREAVHTLSAAPHGRFAQTCLTLASLGLAEATGTTLEQARATCQARWEDGSARERLRAMIVAQGGDARVCDDPDAVLPAAAVRHQVAAPTGGVVARLPARPVGELTVLLGAGRTRKGQAVDPAVGIDLHVAEGDPVEAGQPLATVHARTADAAQTVAARLLEAVEIGPEGQAAPTVLDILRG